MKSKNEELVFKEILNIFDFLYYFLEIIFRKSESNKRDRCSLVQLIS
jgi:hypothetical protein